MQTVLVIVTVSAALSYLGWKAWHAFFKKESKCEGCAFSKSTGLADQ